MTTEVVIEMPKPIAKFSQLCGAIEMMPGRPAAPIARASVFVPAIHAEPAAEPMIAA